MHSVVMNRGIFSCDLLHMWRIVLMFWHMIISKAVAVILTLVCQVPAISGQTRDSGRQGYVIH